MTDAILLQCIVIFSLAALPGLFFSALLLSAEDGREMAEVLLWIIQTSLLASFAMALAVLYVFELLLHVAIFLVHIGMNGEGPERAPELLGIRSIE